MNTSEKGLFLNPGDGDAPEEAYEKLAVLSPSLMSQIMSFGGA